MVPACDCVADIGTDHGKLPAAILRAGRAGRVLCCDISEDSLAKARGLLSRDNRAEFRAADGLEALSPGEADCIVIAGMGGHTICEILERRPKGLPGGAEMLLSAHTALPLLRRFLQDNGFSIEEETIAREDRRYYPIMRVKEGGMALSETQILLGRFLPFGAHPLREEYLTHILRRLRKEAQAADDAEKWAQVRLIEEVLG